MAPRKRGRPSKLPNLKDLLAKSIPTSEIFNEDEKKMYDSLINIYLQDFDEDQLTANDMDDIMLIAMNRVLEFRLLKLGKDSGISQLDSSAAIERLRKQTDKLKESLATRRRDRIDPKKFSGFSIVDLAAAFDSEHRNKLLKRDEEMEEEEDGVVQAGDSVGNRLDEDVIIEGVEDE
jgi:hypothetical protein